MESLARLIVAKRGYASQFALDLIFFRGETGFEGIMVVAAKSGGSKSEDKNKKGGSCGSFLLLFSNFEKEKPS